MSQVQVLPVTLMTSKEAQQLLAASKLGPGPIHLRYCETMVANATGTGNPDNSFKALELFARAPEMAQTIIDLEKKLGEMPESG